MKLVGKGEKENSPRCKLCNEVITKYKMDLASADCVEICVDSKLKFELVCGDCARAIATKLINDS